MKRGENIEFERKIPKFLQQYKEDLQDPLLVKRGATTEEHEDKEASLNEDYEDALKYGTIVSADEVTESLSSSSSKRQKIGYEEFIQKSKGKHFTSSSTSVGQFKSRGDLPEDPTIKDLEDDDEVDKRKGLELISSTIEANKAKDKRRSSHRKNQEQQSQKLTNQKLLSFDVDE